MEKKNTQKSNRDKKKQPQNKDKNEKVKKSPRKESTISNFGSNSSRASLSFNGSNMMNVSSLRGSKLTQNFSVISGNIDKESKGPEDELDNSQKKLLKTPPKSQKKRRRLFVSTPSKRDEIERKLIESDSMNELAKYYIRQSDKMNIWTHLYKNINDAIAKITTMCELEGKKEFCEGIKETLENAIKDIDLIESKVVAEESQGKSCAWNIKINENKLEFDEMKNTVVDVYDVNSQVEFSMLEELVNEGKLTFDAAIVLIVRERAAILKNHQPAFSCSEVFDDSISLPFSEKSRNFAPNKLPFSRLVKRINFKANYIKQLEQISSEEQKKNKEKILNKLQRADENRQELKEAEKKRLMKYEERLNEVRARREETKNDMREEIFNKEKESQKRKKEILDEIKAKARDQALKANEIAFISALEKETKKLNFDEKLKKTHERRKKILMKVKERQKELDEMRKAALLKKKELDQEKQEYLRKKLLRVELAKTRRNLILKEKGKKLKKRKKKVIKGSKVLISDDEDQSPKSRIKKQFKRDKEMFDNIFNQNKDFILKNDDSFDEGNLSLYHEDFEDNSFKQDKKRSKSLDHELFCSLFDLAEHSIILYKPKQKLKDKDKSRRMGKKKNKKYANQLKKILIGAGSKKMRRLMNKMNTKRNYLENYEKIIDKKNYGKSVAQKSRKRNFNLEDIFNSSEENTTKVQKERSRKLRKSVKSRKSAKKKNRRKKSGTDKDSDYDDDSSIDFLGDTKTKVIIERQDEQEPEESKEDAMEVKITWCNLCDKTLMDNETKEMHLESKYHKRMKSYYRITAKDEKHCILNCTETKLISTRIKALKKRCKKIRQRMTIKSLKHETSLIGKENLSTPHKNRLQKISKELDKMVNHQAKDYTILDEIMTELARIINKNVDNDLHLLRTTRIMKVLIDFCKAVNVCQKNNYRSMVIVLNKCTKILVQACCMKQNRTYMLLTNKVIPLVDLLKWAWANSSRFVYCYNFIPQLFHLISFLLKHKVTDPNAENLKINIVEYIICSGLFLKLKQRFTSFNSGLDLSTSAGKVPLALLKAIAMLETVTNQLEEVNKPAFVKSKKMNSSVRFLFKVTEVAGCLHLVSGILLSGGSFKRSSHRKLPQTILSVVMLTLKVFCNVSRIDLDLIQQILTDPVNLEQFYHCIVFLLDYSLKYYDTSEEVKELTHEIILLLGYFTYLNPKTQELMSRGHGSNNIISKLLSLPYSYFVGFSIEKDILFPTLICIVFNNKHNYQLLLKEMSADLLIEFLEHNMQLYNKQMKLQGQNVGYIDKLFPQDNVSISSIASSANSIRLNPSASHNFNLFNRFSVEKWENAVSFLRGNREGAKRAI